MGEEPKTVVGIELIDDVWRAKPGTVGIEQGKALTVTTKTNSNGVDAIVWVPRRKAARRRRKEFYTADLTGCSVIHENQAVGSVVSVCTTESDTFLEISSASGSRYLLPFNRRYFSKVDIKKQMITVPENWLLE